MGKNKRDRNKYRVKKGLHVRENPETKAEKIRNKKANRVMKNWYKDSDSISDILDEAPTFLQEQNVTYHKVLTLEMLEELVTKLYNEKRINGKIKYKNKISK